MPNKEIYTDNIEIRQRLDAITPGKWYVVENKTRCYNIGYVADVRGISISSAEEHVKPEVDADFIAHAPDDMRRLLDRGDYFKTILNIAMNILISLNYSELPEDMSHEIYKKICLMEEIMDDFKEKFEHETDQS